jgi:quaternary ammonium compound-resistance protein SugE
VGSPACALISFALLTVALKKLEFGSAYAVWTGLGAAGTALVGMWALGESVSLVKIVSIGLILTGVIARRPSGVTPP